MPGVRNHMILVLSRQVFVHRKRSRCYSIASTFGRPQLNLRRYGLKAVPGEETAERVGNDSGFDPRVMCERLISEVVSPG